MVAPLGARNTFLKKHNCNNTLVLLWHFLYSQLIEQMRNQIRVNGAVKAFESCIVAMHRVGTCHTHAKK